MTKRDFSAMIRDTIKGKNAGRAFAKVYVGEVGKTLDPTHIEGWFDTGRVVSLPEFARSPDKEKITAGLPGGLLINLPKEYSQDMEFTFDMFRLQTLQMATVSNAKIKINYATDGQTTISNATKKSGTLAAGTGLKVGDSVIVGTKHATYGGFDEMTIVTKINGTEVEFEPLSVVPANGATFKKIAGKASGTNKTDTGIVIPNVLIREFPRVQLEVVFHVVSSKSIMVTHIPEFEITGGKLPNFSDSLGRAAFSGNPIIQDEKAYLMEDGSTEMLPWYDDTYIIPYEGV